MTSSPNTLSDKELLKQLQEILLKEDRTAFEQLQVALDDPIWLSEKISPIIEERMEFLKETFPKEFQGIVDNIIEKKIKASQAEILDVIYPVVGKMIKKYIAHQIQMLKDTVDETIRNTFSRKGILWRIRSVFLGIKSSDSILYDLKDHKIEEIYLIQRDSGLLFGSASTGNTIDQDAIAGMLTAIKSFVEDAFKRDSEDLEMIQYGTYKILLQNFYSYYIALAISGTFSSVEREEISNELLDFAEKNLKTLPAEPDEAIFRQVSEKLKQQFIIVKNEK